VGDFNLPDVCWSSLIGQSPFSNSFCDFVYEHNFSQLVDCPTHVKGNILDLVFTTSESIISDLLVTRPRALISTDHRTVTAFQGIDGLIVSPQGQPCESFSA